MGLRHLKLNSLLAHSSPRPWVRFCARQADYLLFFPVAWIVLPIVLGRDLVDIRGIVLNVGLTLAWVPFEALCVFAWGATPGKWFLNTLVGTANGEKLRFGAAFERSAKVWLRGMGLGIPLVALFTMARGYWVLSREGSCRWDSEGGILVFHEAVRLDRLALGIASIVGLRVVSWNVSEPGSAPYRDQAVRQVDELRESLESFARESGGSLAPVSELFEGSLRRGEEGAHGFSTREEETLVAVAGCDDDCADLDMRIVDAEGRTVESDTELDSTPVLRFRALPNQEYSLAVSMYECSSEPCYYAMQIFSTEGAALVGSQGTCFRVSPDGLVMTALHVVGSAKEVVIGFPDGEMLAASVVHTSFSNDIALLRTEKAGPAYLSLAPSDKVALGDPVFTIGYPATVILGYEAKYAEGTVSSLSGPLDEHSLLQVSLPIQPGNSGGPVVNDQGEVVGVIVATAESDVFQDVTGGLPQGVNWAVKSSYVRGLLDAAPEPLPKTKRRKEAIARVQGAVCRVESKS